MSRTFQIFITLGISLFLAWSPLTPAQSGDTDACLDEDNAYNRLMCLVDLGETKDGSGPCMAAEDPGIRWQCVAIVAERIDRPGLCGEIPVDMEDGRELRDVCLSDIAEARADGALCADIETPGLRDSCYLKVVRAGADAALCEEIGDAALKSACTGEPVTMN